MLKVCILKRKEKNPKIQKDIKKIWYINLISFLNEHRSKKGKLCFLKLIYMVYSCLHMSRYFDSLTMYMIFFYPSDHMQLTF